jgi:hypothetical protein
MSMMPSTMSVVSSSYLEVKPFHEPRIDPRGSVAVIDKQRYVQSYFPPPRRRSIPLSGAPIKLGGQVAGRVIEVYEMLNKVISSKTSKSPPEIPRTHSLLFTNWGLERRISGLIGEEGVISKLKPFPMLEMSKGEIWAQRR